MDLLAEAHSSGSSRSEKNGVQNARLHGGFSKKLEALQDIAVPRIEETLIDNDPDPFHAPLPSNEEPQSVSASDAAFLGPSVVEQTELSVIVEGDEPAESSHNSIQLPRHGAGTEPALSPSPGTEPPIGSTNVRLNGERSAKSDRGSAKHDSVSSTDSFHSANVSLPTTTKVLSDAEVPPKSPSPAIATPPAVAQSGAASTRVENMTEPLPEIPPWHPPSTYSGEAVTEPLPSIPPEHTAPLRDVEARSPKELTHKKSSNFLPNLPAPIPARKSMRTLKEPPTTVVINTVTPGTALGGKRSSWLIRAREAKAMEDTTKKIGSLGVTTLGTMTVASTTTTAPRGSGTLKRKSEERSNDAPTGRIKGDGERHKAAKLSDGDAAPTRIDARNAWNEDSTEQTGGKTAGSHDQLPFAVFGLVEQLIPGHEEPDGILNRLKKTVEGLGARVGKSMGKSLGGPSAATLLAQARAAAEARVVKREIAAGSVDVAESSPTAAKTGPSDGRAYTADHSRLSISDLASTQDKIANQVPRRLPSLPVFQPQLPPAATFPKANKTSTSTTPPDSPPQSRPAISTHATHLIFRGSPVFVPPPKNAMPPTRKEVSAKPLPTFSFVPPSGPIMAAAPIIPLSRALSAQTTLESVASEPVFDTSDDKPAWMPTTQDSEYSSVYDSQPHAMPDSQYHDKNNLEDDDDSWPLDEKGPIWTFPTADDDDTWSDMNSVAPDVEPDVAGANQEQAVDDCLPPSSQDVAGAFKSHPDQDYEDEYLGLDESDMEDIAIEAGTSSVNLVDVCPKFDAFGVVNSNYRVPP